MDNESINLSTVSIQPRLDDAYNYTLCTIIIRYVHIVHSTYINMTRVCSVHNDVIYIP